MTSTKFVECFGEWQVLWCSLHSFQSEYWEDIFELTRTTTNAQSQICVTYGVQAQVKWINLDPCESDSKQNTSVEFCENNHHKHSITY